MNYTLITYRELQIQSQLHSNTQDMLASIFFPVRPRLEQTYAYHSTLAFDFDVRIICGKFTHAHSCCVFTIILKRAP